MHSSPRPKPAILVVDAHELSRALLTEALATRLDAVDVIGLASPDAWRADATVVARLAIFCMPAQAGAAAAERWTREHPDGGTSEPAVPLLLLCEEDDARAECRALAAGFKGLISSEASLELLVAAARVIMAGGIYFPQLVSAAAPLVAAQDAGAPIDTGAPRRADAAAVTDAPSPAGTPALTARETLVLAELRRGHSNKVIARALNMSENTAKMHVRRILAKLRVRNRTEAAVLVNTPRQ
ncbi:response regulator transcription factor [Salinarimonas sp.]|uniref:response regulator transcription factor n=1 Tax=Salinarimonas sp. TaxID=2766526 RepID=UPI0032D8C2D8